MSTTERLFSGLLDEYERLHRDLKPGAYEEFARLAIPRLIKQARRGLELETANEKLREQLAQSLEREADPKRAHAVLCVDRIMDIVRDHLEVNDDGAFIDRGPCAQELQKYLDDPKPEGA